MHPTHILVVHFSTHQRCVGTCDTFGVQAKGPHCTNQLFSKNEKYWCYLLEIDFDQKIGAKLVGLFHTNITKSPNNSIKNYVNQNICHIATNFIEIIGDMVRRLQGAICDVWQYLAGHRGAI